MKYVCVILCCIGAGCGGPKFRNVGVGRSVGISMESIDAYATEHGVTKAEARAQLQGESDRRRISEHAAKYGISEAEAKRQLEHAASQLPGK